MKGQGCSTEHLTFVCSGGRHFQIGAQALALMRHYVQDVPTKPEAGGVLLGRHSLKRVTLLLTALQNLCRAIVRAVSDFFGRDDHTRQ